MSIDSFINMFARKLDIMALNYQVIIQKKWYGNRKRRSLYI
jgi:hypothetical protein